MKQLIFIRIVCIFVKSNAVEGFLLQNLSQNSNCEFSYFYLYLNIQLIY